MVNTKYPEGAIPVGQVYGTGWEDIKSQARAITGIRNGVVTLDSRYVGLHRGSGENAGKWYAWVVVTPADAPSPGWYTLDELKRAARELASGLSEDRFFDNLATQVHKNRLFDALTGERSQS